MFNFYSESFAPSDGAIGEYARAFEENNPFEPPLNITAPEAQYIGQFLITDFEVFHRMLRPEEYGIDVGVDVFTYDSKIPELVHLNEIKGGLFSSDAELIRHFDVMLCHGCLPYEIATLIDDHIDASGGTDSENLALILGAIFQSPAYNVTF